MDRLDIVKPVVFDLDNQYLKTLSLNPKILIFVIKKRLIWCRNW